MVIISYIVLQTEKGSMWSRYEIISEIKVTFRKQADFICVQFAFVSLKTVSATSSIHNISFPSSWKRD